MNNLDLIYSLFNIHLFQKAKINISEIEYFCKTSPGTVGNALVEELLHSIRDYQFENIDVPLFQSICYKLGKTQAETQSIIGEIIRWKGYTKSQMSASMDFLEELLSNSVLRRASNLFKDSPKKMVEYIKSSEIKMIGDDEGFSCLGFDELDPNSMASSITQNIYRSGLDWINEQSEFGGLTPGIFLVCSPPGVGKTLFLCQTALQNSILRHGDIPRRTVVFGLGDMSLSDYVLRMSCMIHPELKQKEVIANLKNHYLELKNIISDRLLLSVNPACTVSVDDIINFVMSVENDPKRRVDIIHIDYDGTLKMNSGNGSDDSTYQAYGEIYAKLTKLTAMGKLVYIYSQPKISAWSNGSEGSAISFPVMNMEVIGDSRKKQEYSDQILTISRAPYAVYPMGVYKICKDRRCGMTGSTMPYIRIGATIKFIPRVIYDMLVQHTEPQPLSIGDIDRMIGQYESARTSIQNSGMNLSAGPNQAPKGPGIANPFSGKK